VAAVTDRSNCLPLITLNLYLASSVSLGLAYREAHRHPVVLVQLEIDVKLFSIVFTIGDSRPQGAMFGGVAIAASSRGKADARDKGEPQTPAAAFFCEAPCSCVRLDDGSAFDA
jgi:hypothetical protein